MRVALVVGSGYSKNGQLSELPSADRDCELVARRLSDPDAGFEVVRLEAERGLAERIEQHLADRRGPIERLLFYFSGYCVLSEERGPGLLLDGDRLGTFSVPRLKKLLAYFAPSSCLLMDALAVGEGDEIAETIVESVGELLTSEASGVSALCAARKSDRPDSFGGSAFTGAILMVLDWLAGSRSAEQAVDLAWLYEGLKADPSLLRAIPAIGLFPAGARFVVLPALAGPELPRFESPGDLDEITPQFSAAGADPLPSFAEAPRYVPPAPPVPWASEPLPSFESDDSSDDTGGPLPSFAALSGAAADNVYADLFGEAPVKAPEPPALSRPGEVLAPAPMPAPPARRPELEAEEPRAPLPSFAPSPEVAATLFEAGEFERAADEYEAVLALLTEPGERSPLLARQAQALVRAGKLDEAARVTAEALDIDAGDVAALAARAELAHARGDAQALAAAAAAWLQLAPADRRALELSARAAEALGDPGRAVAARRELASHPDGSIDERAHALFEASRLAEAGLGDAELARSLVKEGLAIAPARSELLERAGALFAEASQREELVSYYERALAESRDPNEMRAIAGKLDELCRGGAAEPARVARSLEQLVAFDPGNLALSERLVELYAAAQEPSRALEHCRRAARIAPTQAATYRRALSLFQAAGDGDGAWNAASVLDCLGEADINEALLASQHKPDGLLAARGSVAYAEWQSALLATDCDAKIWDLLEALGPSGIRVGVGFAKHQNRYVEPDPALYQDPEKSTTTLAKTLGWTARLLGLTPPALYVLPDLGNRVDVGATEQATALASRNLASGLGLGQLAFLWGRQLPRFRNELRALSYFRSVSELATLVTAALALGEAPGVSVRALEGDGKRLFAALKREVRGPAFDRVRVVARDFPSEEVEARAAHTLRGMELIGVRAGLIACGDVLVAAELVRRFPTETITQPDEQLAELCAFAVSEPYSAVRRRIGVAITG